MTSINRKLRMGMVGGGQGAFIGEVHRTAAAMDGEIDLVAGCFSRDYENTKTTGRELYLSEDRLYKSYEEMAEKEAKLPEEQRIDFVAVVTPNKTHFPVSKAFLEAGFHVVCDKPMTFSLEEAEELVSLVEKTGLVFALTHNYTGNSLVREARKLFKSGKMGTVRKVLVEYLQDFLMYPVEKEGNKQAIWRLDPKQSGIAGTLGDIGTHALNLVEFITGDPVVELCADLSTFLPDRKLDEDGNILVRLHKGGKGCISVSQIATGEENDLSCKIYASEGGISWAQEHSNYLWIHKYGEPKKLYSRNADYLTEAATEVCRTPSGHPEGYLEAFANIYVDAAEAIRRYISGNPMKTEDYKFPTVYDGLRGMQFIYKAIESSQNGSAWVKMSG